MIPPVSIGNLICFCFGLVFVVYLYFSYQRSGDIKIGYFFKAFFWSTVAMGLLASPEIIFKDAEIIALVFAIYPVFGYLGVIYLVFVPLELLGWKKLQKLYLWGLIAFGCVTTIINIYNLRPARHFVYESFVFWEDTRGVIMNTIIGIVYALSLLSVAIFFISNGLKSEERFIKIRSFLLAGGIMISAAGSTINQLGSWTRTYLTTVAGVFLCLLSFIFLFFGIFYKYKPKED